MTGPRGAGGGATGPTVHAETVRSTRQDAATASPARIATGTFLFPRSNARPHVRRKCSCAVKARIRVIAFLFIGLEGSGQVRNRLRKLSSAGGRFNVPGRARPKTEPGA